MTQVLFENAVLFDGEAAEPVEGASVLVEGGHIREVADRPIAVSGEARRVDVAGRTLMPGLIDAHFHAMAADPNIAKLDGMPGNLLAQHARVLLESALARGFTTIRDAGGADHGLAKALDEGLIRGPRLFYAGRALSQTGGHGDFRPFDGAVCCCGLGVGALCRIADGVAAVQQAARDELRKGAHQIKIMASGGVASPSDPIWNLQYSEDEIRAVVWEARSWRTYVMAHAYTAEAIARCVEYGVRSIEHGNLIDDAAAAACAQAGAWVVPTLATYDVLEGEGASLGLPAVSVAKVKDVRDAGIRALEILKRNGVNVGFGTDLLGAMHRHQSREFEIRAQVLSPIEILRQATSGNAALLQREGKLGVVRAGALADLIVVDGDPLRDVSVLARGAAAVPLVMRGGTVEVDRLG